MKPMNKVIFNTKIFNNFEHLDGLKCYFDDMNNISDYYFTIYEERLNLYGNSQVILYGINHWFPSSYFDLISDEQIEKLDLKEAFPVYDKGEKLIFTTDIKKIEECTMFDSQMQIIFLNLAGQVVTVLQDIEMTSRPDRIILEEMSMYYCPINLISKRWYEGYEPPKIKKKILCSYCNNFFSYISNEEETLPEEDKTLCPECRKRHFITPYHRYQPHIDFYKKKKDDNLFLGIEIEVDDGGEDNCEAKKIMSIMNKKKGKHFIYCSHDGSLNNGFEIITQPATLNYHKSIKKDYKTCFKQLISDGYRSHQTSTAGIHVHFSRAFFADNEEDNLAKLLYLVEKFWDEITIFSRRNYREIERYSKKIKCPSKEFVDAYNKKDIHEGHYYAVNICNPNTIELRMFRGTLNIDTFMAILDFVDSIARTAKNKSINELQSLTFEELLTPLAKRYFKTRLSAYNYEVEE